MTVWNLDPGCEQPAARSKRVGNLTSADIVRRCEQLGARVERSGGGGHRVFPPDRTRPPVSIPSRFAHGRGHLNVVTALRRAGLDVTLEPPKEPAMPTPADVAARKPTAGPTAAVVAELREQVETMLGMLAEAETRDRALAERVDRLTARLDATPGAPPERDPHADLDDAIVALLKASVMKLSPAIIAANLDVACPPELVAQRLDALVDRDVATVFEPTPGARLYRLLPA